MKFHLFLFFVVALIALGIAEYIPVNVLSWNPNLSPCLIVSAIVLFWLLIVYPRQGLIVDEDKDVFLVCVLMLVTAFFFSEFTISEQMRLELTGAGILLFLSCWAVDKDLQQPRGQKRSWVQPL